MAVTVQPMAVVGPEEVPVSLVDFGETFGFGGMRARCRAMFFRWCVMVSWGSLEWYPSPGWYPCRFASISAGQRTVV